MEASRQPHARQAGSVLSMDAVLAEYPPDQFILLLPPNSKTLLDARPMWRIDVSTVKIDPDDTSMVYPVKKTWDKTTKPWREIVERVALQRAALDLIAAAAEIQTLAKRTDDRGSQLYAEYTAFGIMTTPSGAIRGQARSAEWDGELERDKVQLEAERHVDRGIADGWKGYTADARERLINDRVSTEWLREREFGKRKTESKAANRALRALLAMPASYACAELKQKAFAIAKFVFSPDLDDPDIKRLVVLDGLHAQKQLFGGALARAVDGQLAPQLMPGEPNNVPLLAAPAPAEDDMLDMFPESPAAAPARPAPSTPAQDATHTAPPPPDSEPAAPAPAADPDKADIIIKLATAKALPHLDNIWNKYYRIAERDGWLDEFKTVYSGRKQSLRGGA